MREVLPPIQSDARLLIVDDSPINVVYLEKLLLRAGYADVVSTTSPNEGERLAAECDPDLAILDLHMPGMSGFEL